VRYLLLLILTFPLLSQDQPFQRHEFTFSGGQAWQVDAKGSGQGSAVSLGGTYSYHLKRWLALDGGVLMAFDPSGIQSNSLGSFDTKDRFTWLHFGPRFILPLGRRFELSASAAPAIELYSVAGHNPRFLPDTYNVLGIYFYAGAAVAIGPGRHIWLGITSRGIVSNGEYGRRSRVIVCTGDIGFRF